MFYQTFCFSRTKWFFIYRSTLFCYVARFLDSLIYFFLPQINIVILRLIQGRDLRHRMVGRTVVIGDCPWVAQAADAFLSKLFACSYSIAGLNVLSGNPADHLVHRHTHRVVRGTLLVCGRPDGRLSALTTLEESIYLSINQASSIERWVNIPFLFFIPLHIIDTMVLPHSFFVLYISSLYIVGYSIKSIGGTCETYTIGHNPYKLPLSKKHICLQTERPNFACENILRESGRRQLSIFTNMSAERNTSSKASVTTHAMVSLNHGIIS
jgi:hypothetical protein